MGKGEIIQISCWYEVLWQPESVAFLLLSVIFPSQFIQSTKRGPQQLPVRLKQQLKLTKVICTYFKGWDQRQQNKAQKERVRIFYIFVTGGTSEFLPLTPPPKFGSSETAKSMQVRRPSSGVKRNCWIVQFFVWKFTAWINASPQIDLVRVSVIVHSQLSVPPFHQSTDRTRRPKY